jgi:hypothetical protein
MTKQVLLAELIERFDEVRHKVSVSDDEWANCHLLIAAEMAYNGGLTRDQFLVVVRAALSLDPRSNVPFVEFSILDPRAIRSGEAHRAAFVAMARTADRSRHPKLSHRELDETIIRASLSHARRLSCHQLIAAIKHYYDEAAQ